MRFFSKMSRASYTVEAAVVMSVTMIFIGSAILLGFDIYKECAEEIATDVEVKDSLDTFRAVSAGKDMWEEIREEY